MKRLFWVFLILLLSGCTSGPSFQEMMAADPPKDDKLIVPGWRVGKVYLGMTSAALLAAMGEPESTTPYKNSRSFNFENGALVVRYDMKTEQVDVIDVFLGSYKTAEGVQIGMSELAVVVKLGKPQASYSEDLGRRHATGELGRYGIYCYKTGIMLNFDNYSSDKPPRAIPYQVTWVRVMPSKEWRTVRQCE